MQHALSSIRVLDLTHYIAGPYCTKLLADYGAEVIKVEKPGTGDGARALPPFFADQPGRERSGLFFFLNTNKQSLTLNLKHDRGRETVLRLAQQADVLVENFRPGVMSRLGLAHEDLAKANPRLVSVSLTNFGSSGPYRDYQLTDSVSYALGGWTYPMGELDRPPVQPGGAFGQYVAGLYAAIGALQAVRHRDATGEGQTVEVSIQEALIATTLYDFVAFSYAGFVRKRSGRQFHLAYPNLVILPCADGYVGIHAGLPHQIHALLELVERPDLAADPRLTFPELAKHAKEFHDALLPWLQKRGKWDIYHAAQARGLPLSPIPTPAEVVEWQHLKERQSFLEIEHPEGGTVKIPGPPFRENGKPLWSLRRAPLLGEHSEAILCGRLDYSKADLQQMQTVGTV
ncbi:MAG TPA: CoA transferase [Candidatus Binatia bacterium]|nr:CoA transferase [Candidatus Binatia bacterium]